MDLDAVSLDTLCDLIYDIPSMKNGWSNFSKTMLMLLDASYIHIQAVDLTYNVLSYSHGVGVLPLADYAAAELDYLRYPVESDPRWKVFLQTERQGWYQCHTHITEEFVQHSDLYQKILLPIGLRYVATHTLIQDETLCVFWSISTALQRGPLNATELHFLQKLLPHLTRITIANRNLYEFSLMNIVGYNLIDQLPQAVMLLNLAGQVIHLNIAAKKMLMAYSILYIEDNKLVLPMEDQGIFLKYLYKIEEIIRYKNENFDQLSQIQLAISHSNLQCSISPLASEKEMSVFGIRPLVMLTFEQQQLAKSNLQYIQQCYHLTPREVELCSHFVKAEKLDQIAEKMGLTRSSVRTYLRNIYAKVACNSQAELMRILMEQNR